MIRGSTQQAIGPNGRLQGLGKYQPKIDLRYGDCLEEMKSIPSASVSVIVFDPPYGTTSAAWDQHLDHSVTIKEFERILTPLGTVVAFGSDSFSFELHRAFADHGEELQYRYSSIWKKTRPTSFFHAANRPLKIFEDILIFSKGVMGHAGYGAGRTQRRMTYNPQGLVKNEKPHRSFANKPLGQEVQGSESIAARWGRSPLGVNLRANGSEHQLKRGEFTKFPDTIYECASENSPLHRHPTRKPIALLRELIATYSNPRDVILDPTMGVGSTGVACAEVDRRFVGIELDESYFRSAQDRLGIAKLKAAA